MEIFILIGAGVASFFGTLILIALLIVAQHLATKGKYTRIYLTRATENHPKIKLPNFLRKFLV